MDNYPLEHFLTSQHTTYLYVGWKIIHFLFKTFPKHITKKDNNKGKYKMDF